MSESRKIKKKPLLLQKTSPTVSKPMEIRREPAKLKPFFNPVILKAARKSSERKRLIFDAQPKAPKVGFDTGVDPKELEGMCKFYHNQQQIGIPTYHESYCDFGKVIAGRKQGKWILTSYTIEEGNTPMILSRSAQRVITVRIHSESGTVQSV